MVSLIEVDKKRGQTNPKMKEDNFVSFLNLFFNSFVVVCFVLLMKKKKNPNIVSEGILLCDICHYFFFSPIFFCHLFVSRPRGGNNLTILPLVSSTRHLQEKNKISIRLKKNMSISLVNESNCLIVILL